MIEEYNVYDVAKKYNINVKELYRLLDSSKVYRQFQSYIIEKEGGVKELIKNPKNHAMFLYISKLLDKELKKEIKKTSGAMFEFLYLNKIKKWYNVNKKVV